MSREATSWTWEHSEARGNDRVVLLVLANEADSDGLDAKASLRRICQLGRCGMGTTRRALERLEAAGELLAKRPATIGRGHYTTYALTMGRDPVALAELIGWPAPRLIPEAVQRWEQLTLEAETRRARHKSEGYDRREFTARVAPLPILDEPPVDGEKPVETGDNAPETRAKVPKGATGGTSPQTLTLETSRPAPGIHSEAATRAMIERQATSRARAVPMPAELRKRVHGGDQEAPGDPDAPPEPSPDAPLEADPAPASPPADPGPLEADSSSTDEGKADRWSERADLT